MLASMLMESAFGGTLNDVSPEILRKYTHDNGATLIAMESAEDLRDVFVDTVYTMETLDFQLQVAAMEGASESVTEAITDKVKEKANLAVQTVRTKLKSLWEKVKGFFKNVKTYILSIFQNAVKFVKANQSTLKKLDLTGFKYDAFEYTIDTEGKKMAETIQKEANGIIEFVTQMAKQQESNKANSTKVDQTSTQYDSYKEDRYNKFVEREFGGSKEESDVTKYVWAKLRGGAQNESDKKVFTGSIDSLVDAIIGSNGVIKAFDNMWTSQDRMFTNAMSKCKELERLDTSVYPLTVKEAGNLYSGISKLSSLYNKVIGNAKTAVSEMVGDYMKVIRKALRYKPAKD